MFIVGLLRVIAFQRSSIPKPFRVPTYLFIDEFQNFLSADIEKALTQLRKYGLHLILANQYVGQSVSYTLQKALFSAGVKIAGRNERSSLRDVSREMEIPIPHLQRLRIGQFYLQAGERRPLLMKTSKQLLGDRQSMSENSWQQIKQHNLKHYYHRLSESPPLPDFLPPNPTPP